MEVLLGKSSVNGPCSIAFTVSLPGRVTEAPRTLGRRPPYRPQRPGRSDPVMLRTWEIIGVDAEWPEIIQSSKNDSWIENESLHDDFRPVSVIHRSKTASNINVIYNSLVWKTHQIQIGRSVKNIYFHGSSIP